MQSSMAIQFVKSADIGEARYRWLEEHPEISFPALVRDAIDGRMGKVD
jgi:hypothetical protein